MSKISVRSEDSINWNIITHLWCTYRTLKNNNLSRRVSVNHHMSNVCCFLFKKDFFSYVFATFFSDWYGIIHWEKHWNLILRSGDGLWERKQWLQDGWQSQKLQSHAENLLCVDVKRTVQDNACVKSINLDVQSYVDVLDIATIALFFNDFYSIVFFSKQWTKLDIFFKKSTIVI